MHGVESAKRRRERVACSTQYGRPQEDEVDRFKPLGYHPEAFSCFLGCQRTLES